MNTKRMHGTIFSLLILTETMIAPLLLPVQLYAAESPKQGIIRTAVEPTCTDDGYIREENTQTGTITIETLPSSGHQFSEWIINETAGYRTRRCSVCGFEEKVRISTVSEDSIAKLYLYGSLDEISKKNRVTLTSKFEGMNQSFECYAIMTTQGHSTLGYEKHNYTVRFYDDEEAEQKHRLQFNDWNPEHKYILKANYLDISQCRNLVGAAIWEKMASSRPHLPKRISLLPTLGAVEGFPIVVYLNDEFFGLYTMNLHKDDDLFGMEDGEKTAIVICNSENSDEALFLHPAEFAEDFSSDWELEYCGTENESWAKDSFNSLIDFVLYSSDAEFRNDLGKYLDVESAVDYLIFIYALGLKNSGAKDLVMVNFGKEWIASAYDMEEAFGFDAENAEFLSPTEFLPAKNTVTGNYESGTRSYLWDRMLRNYFNEIVNRYAVLRSSVLAKEEISEMVTSFIGKIPEAYYDMDLNLYRGRPIEDIHMEEQITEYIENRLKELDEVFLTTVAAE